VIQQPISVTGCKSKPAFVRVSPEVVVDHQELRHDSPDHDVSFDIIERRVEAARTAGFTAPKGGLFPLSVDEWSGRAPATHLV